MKIDVVKYGIRYIEDSTLRGTVVEINKYCAEEFVKNVKEKHGLDAKITDNEDCDDGYVLVKIE
jgi:hypothetical protein